MKLKAIFSIIKIFNSEIKNKLLRLFGYTCEKHVYHDLDHLAGSWSASDEKLFTENTQAFKQIDKELWYECKWPYPN